MKKILGRYGNDRGHWVGDGFPVRSLFSYHGAGSKISPFLLLDYAGPHVFEPTTEKRGVGQHPHRGFETVSIAYEGEVAHKDSTGQGGVIGAGDVQWMTAGAGILHEEYHSAAYARTGGPFRMVQLWVNLPAKHKMTPPRYQSIVKGDIPTVALPNGAGTARIIAGELGGTRGPAHTFTAVNVWDMHLTAGSETTVPVPEGHTGIVVVLKGSVGVNGEQTAGDAEALLLDTRGSSVGLRSSGASHVLFLSGEPIHEPIAGQGPFVMNTQEEIRQAMVDFNSGRFGRIPHAR